MSRFGTQVPYLRLEIRGLARQGLMESCQEM